MQNTQLGGWFIPDIRPEKIETFEEINTTTNESGESQQETIEHKSVDLHPVLDGKLDEKGWLRTHAGAVWYNAKQKISVLQKIDNIVANIGILSDLLTTDKSNIVAAINEQYSKTLIYEDIDIGDVTIPTAGFVRVHTGTKSNLFATIAYWKTNTGAFNVTSYDQYVYAIGDSGTKIVGLKVRLWRYNG